eukprot:TRINITY_DN23458_c0_g1_i6.p1 TRINITY_DN23458_c0_g1~~TRINITY_DN23458_c0_g1_i6.p1  ORF type:complete len:274 (+),score=39.06 TRINITY_DN23458_c0_g1_i6:525-1346(+)
MSVAASRTVITEQEQTQKSEESESEAALWGDVLWTPVPKATRVSARSEHVAGSSDQFGEAGHNPVTTEREPQQKSEMFDSGVVLRAGGTQTSSLKAARVSARSEHVAGSSDQFGEAGHNPVTTEREPQQKSEMFDSGVVLRAGGTQTSSLKAARVSARSEHVAGSSDQFGEAGHNPVTTERGDGRIISWGRSRVSQSAQTDPVVLGEVVEVEEVTELKRQLRSARRECKAQREQCAHMVDRMVQLQYELEDLQELQQTMGQREPQQDSSPQPH